PGRTEALTGSGRFSSGLRACGHLPRNARRSRHSNQAVVDGGHDPATMASGSQTKPVKTEVVTRMSKLCNIIGRLQSRVHEGHVCLFTWRVGFLKEKIISRLAIDRMSGYGTCKRKRSWRPSSPM